jgi:hypothetical protein
MKRLWTHVVGAVSAICGLAIVAPACAHDDSSFFIQNVLAPPQGSSTTGCVFTATPTSPSLPSGLIDVQAISLFADAYYAEFLMANQIIPEGNQQLLQTETSRIIIQGAVITITDAAGNQLAYYTALGAGEIDPSAGEVPGYGLSAFMIVDPSTIKTLQGRIPPGQSETIITYTKAYGTTLGTDHVESNTFEFAIEACNGCLIQYDSVPVAITLASGVMETSPTPNCCGPAPTTSAAKTFCYFGQDSGSVDCHDCAEDQICACGPNASAAECTALRTTAACML